MVVFAQTSHATQLSRGFLSQLRLQKLQDRHFAGAEIDCLALECNTKASTGDALPFLSDNTAWVRCPHGLGPFPAFSTGLLTKWLA
jgi:hypothetical protein